jgi:hypothetical protein
MTAEAPVAPEFDGNRFPYQFEIVPLDSMFVDQSYQRPLTSFVNRIVENYDPALIGTVCLSRRDDGRYAIVDGQTRAEGVKKRRAAKMPAPDALPAVVFFDLTEADEAKLFAKLQRERRGINSFHRFRAARVGGDPEALAIDKIVNGSEYVVGDKPGEISAVASLEKLYRKSPEILERALVIFKEAWKEKYVPNGESLRGMGYFLGEREKVDDETLARKLSINPPDVLKRRAAAFREGAGGVGMSSDRFMAMAIGAVYDTRSS